MVTATINETPKEENLPLSPAPDINGDIVLEPRVSGTVADGSDENQLQVKKHHPTREERLAAYRIQCQNLFVYLTTNVLPSNVDKKEVRNIKNQAKTHQWNSTS